MTDPPDQLSLKADQPTPVDKSAAVLAPIPAPPGWPEPPALDAFHGVCGEIVKQIAAHTKTDPAAILTQLLIDAGSVISAGAFFQVEATHHHPNEYLGLVSDTANTRKGSSFDHVAKLPAETDPSFPARITTGLSTGEGVV